MSDEYYEEIYRLNQRIAELEQPIQRCKCCGYLVTESEQTWKAETVLGTYYIAQAGDTYYACFVGKNRENTTDHVSLESAIEAAQQDYARRVLSGLKYGGVE